MSDPDNAINLAARKPDHVPGRDPRGQMPPEWSRRRRNRSLVGRCRRGGGGVTPAPRPGRSRPKSASSSTMATTPPALPCEPPCGQLEVHSDQDARQTGAACLRRHDSPEPGRVEDRGDPDIGEGNVDPTPARVDRVGFRAGRARGTGRLQAACQQRGRHAPPAEPGSHPEAADHPRPADHQGRGWFGSWPGAASAPACPAPTQPATWLSRQARNPGGGTSPVSWRRSSARRAAAGTDPRQDWHQQPRSPSSPRIRATSSQRSRVAGTTVMAAAAGAEAAGSGTGSVAGVEQDVDLAAVLCFVLG